MTLPVKSPIRLALAIAVISLIAPAMTQEVIGILTVNNGTVMTSTGGEFVSAATGEAIEAGEQIMVSEGGSASVTFSHGVVSHFPTPGVHPLRGIPAATARSEERRVGQVFVILFRSRFCPSLSIPYS